ncbi:hypothetical protein EH223_11195 [candidate division KSB1 bacterium]|nr:hypothetical protein [candidate division KSB1 bacterium]RQW03005.1 MAG: hypothetical protein EH223_11195 [candidate division KSB1 bacterium]
MASKKCDLDLIFENYPDHHSAIAALYGESACFRSLCEDYMNCLTFINTLESQMDSEQHDLEEFKCLLQDLKDELDERINAYDKDDY